MIHEELCKKLKFDHTTKGYIHKLESILENQTQKILWGFQIQTDQRKKNLLSSRPLSKNERKRNDRSVLGPCQRTNKNVELGVTVIITVTGAPGTVSKRKWKNWKFEEESRPSRRQHFLNRPKYCEESWRPEETCCYSYSRERPPDDAGVKYLL